MRSMKRPARLSDQIRRAIDGSDLSRYRLALMSEIDHAAMSRFMAGRAGLSLAALDRLAEVLGLRVMTRPTRGRRRGRATTAAPRRRGGMTKTTLAASIDDLAGYGPALQSLVNKRTRGPRAKARKASPGA